MRLAITCAVLLGPLLVMMVLIAYAVHRSEETRPWSHRSVACASETVRAALAPRTPA